MPSVADPPTGVARLVDPEPRAPEGRAGLHGIWGRPFIDLAPLFPGAPLAAIDAEIGLGLTRVATSYTGGSLKWMGVVAPEVERDPYADFMHVVSRFTPDELATFVSLSDTPGDVELDPRGPPAFGDETDHPLSRRQMLYLKYRYGVYFPWKVAYHLLENVWWEDKNSGAGKSFRPEAREVFPRTIAFVESLPFREIGRAIVFGLEANDHAPLHRDTAPGSKAEVEHCITLCPRRNKRFFLADPERTTRLHVDTPIYWFNDADWHGVEADPYFRYSLRIDGVFEPDFVQRVRRVSEA